MQRAVPENPERCSASVLRNLIRREWSGLQAGLSRNNFTQKVAIRIASIDGLGSRDSEKGRALAHLSCISGLPGKIFGKRRDLLDVGLGVLAVCLEQILQCDFAGFLVNAPVHPGFRR